MRFVEYSFFPLILSLPCQKVLRSGGNQKSQKNHPDHHCDEIHYAKLVRNRQDDVDDQDYDPEDGEQSISAPDPNPCNQHCAGVTQHQESNYWRYR